MCISMRVGISDVGSEDEGEGGWLFEKGVREDEMWWDIIWISFGERSSLCLSVWCWIE